LLGYVEMDESCGVASPVCVGLATSFSDRVEELTSNDANGSLSSLRVL